MTPSDMTDREAAHTRDHRRLCRPKGGAEGHIISGQLDLLSRPTSTSEISASAKQAAGPTTDAPVGRPAHSYDEFTTLREVIIGTAANARIPRVRDLSMWLNLYPHLPESELAEVEVGQFPQGVIEETDEDLDMLAGTLEQLGVVVHRASALDHSRVFGTPDWRSDGFYSYCPRDLALIVGSTIIETPSPMRARYFESHSLNHLFQRYMMHGSPWIAAPKPRLQDHLYQVDAGGLPTLGELEPAFEAANVLRCGKDIFYQVSSSGNELGRVWLETVLRIMGDFRVHPLRGIYAHTHLDSTIALLRPGLALLNPERVHEDTIPAPLRGWDILWCPPVEETSVVCGHPLSSKWIGMNLLMVNPVLAVVDAVQRPLIRALEGRGIEVIPFSLRHARVLGGGFHCVTLDTVRDGELVNYCD